MELITRDEARQKLVIALDAPTVAKARSMIKDVGEDCGVYKIGLELLVGGGFSLADELKREGKIVFLDMKLHDIANTVEKTVANVAGRGFDFLTVHGTNPKMMAAAVKGRGRSDLKLLAVTVLTDCDLNDASVKKWTKRRALMAFETGFDGVIASGHEAQVIRQILPQNFIIQVPGIRPSVSCDDQIRTMTPTEAIQAGADYLIVGRPIFIHENPARMASKIVDEIFATYNEGVSCE